MFSVLTFIKQSSDICPHTEIENLCSDPFSKHVSSVDVGNEASLTVKCLWQLIFLKYKKYFIPVWANWCDTQQSQWHLAMMFPKSIPWPVRKQSQASSTVPPECDQVSPLGVSHAPTAKTGSGNEQMIQTRRATLFQKTFLPDFWQTVFTEIQCLSPLGLFTCWPTNGSLHVGPLQTAQVHCLSHLLQPHAAGPELTSPDIFR